MFSINQQNARFLRNLTPPPIATSLLRDPTQSPDPRSRTMEPQKQHKAPLSSLAGRKKGEPIIACLGNWIDRCSGFGPGSNSTPLRSFLTNNLEFRAFSPFPSCCSAARKLSPLPKTKKEP